MNDSEVVVFPNSYVEIEKGSVWTTKAIEEFVLNVGQNGMGVTIAAAAWPYDGSSRHDSNVGHLEGFQFIKLNRGIGKHRSRVRKALGYVVVLFRILTRVPKRPVWYIFVTSHASTLACIYCCLFRKQFGLYVRGEWSDAGIMGILSRFFFRRATFIIATGDALTGSLRNFNEHVQSVSPMMRFELGDLQEKPSYEINGRASVLYVGSIHPAKGPFELVRALPRIVSCCDVELILVGSGTQQAIEELQAEIQATGYAERVKMLGYVANKQELTTLYTSADIFCLPSHSEGFARVIYEAMCFGLPVVCTDFEERDGKGFLRDRVNCRFVAKKNAEDLANGLIELLTKQPLRSVLGRRSLQNVRELLVRFDSVTHGSQVVGAIRETDNKN